MFTYVQDSHRTFRCGHRKGDVPFLGHLPERHSLADSTGPLKPDPKISEHTLGMKGVEVGWGGGRVTISK